MLSCEAWAAPKPGKKNENCGERGKNNDILGCPAEGVGEREGPAEGGGGGGAEGNCMCTPSVSTTDVIF